VVSRSSSLLTRLGILASAVMDDSMEWIPPLEEIGFVFLNFLGVGSHWMTFSVNPTINPTFSFYPFARTLLAHGF